MFVVMVASFLALASSLRVLRRKNRLTNSASRSGKPAPSPAPNPAFMAVEELGVVSLPCCEFAYTTLLTAASLLS